MALKLRATLLFSKRDSLYKDAISVFLKPLVQDNIFHPITNTSVDGLHQERLKDLVYEVDMVFMLMSMDVLTADCLGSSAQRILMKFHRTERITIIPILLREFLPASNCFSRIPGFPSNQQCIVSEFWPVPERAYKDIYNSIRPICEEKLAYKDRLERTWKQVRKKHKAELYERFDQKYPHSKYAPEAQEHIEALKEERLWLEAYKLDTVNGYYNYLLNTSRKKYFYEAARRIAKVEASAQESWKELEDCGNLKLYYNFNNRFPYEPLREKVEQQIDRKLNRVSKLHPLDSENLSSSFLTFTAPENLEASEIFALNSYIQYFERMKRELARIQDKILWRGFLLGLFYLTIGFILWLFQNFSAEWRELLRWLFFAFIPFCFCLWSFTSLSLEWGFAHRTLQRLALFSVFLKIHFLSKDEKSTLHLLQSFRPIEQRINHIAQKRLRCYLGLDSSLTSNEFKDLEQKLANMGRAGWKDSSFSGA